MLKRILVLVASLLFVLASVNVASACFWGYHQPEVPAELR